MINVGVAGATGWTGSAISEAVIAADDLSLVSAVARSAAGRDIGEVLGSGPVGVIVRPGLADALDGVDVLVDYTAPDAVKPHALAAIGRGVHVVIGTSGLSAADFDELDVAARAAGVGVVAAGNFSLTAALAAAAAMLVAPFLPQREVIDYATATKPDAPSGTARELAERLGAVAASPLAVAIDETVGHPEARGATIGGTQVHSLRLPSFVVSTEVVFAQRDERLSIRHDAGPTAVPYVAGTLLAVRTVATTVGVTRGLDTLLLGSR
jgi:4-hydroxy-tetrahydrodipicolinate reductase